MLGVVPGSSTDCLHHAWLVTQPFIFYIIFVFDFVGVSIINRPVHDLPCEDMYFCVNFYVFATSMY